ncbi:MAG: hypothetical protein ACW981_06845 [Candidatus Hodarchaeales archaeon]
MDQKSLANGLFWGFPTRFSRVPMSLPNTLFCKFTKPIRSNFTVIHTNSSLSNI